MGKGISHSFEDETPDAKALWFQSLPLEERMDMLCMFTDMIIEANPQIAEHRILQLKAFEIIPTG